MASNVAEKLQPIWLTETDVGDSIDVNEAIEALAVALRLEADGKASNVQKALATWPPACAMHALGSLMPERGFAGYKTWCITPKGGGAAFELFDAHVGRLLAVIEAGLLGVMRTSAISGLATNVMADPGADEMALVGTGRQAMMQVAAVAASRPIRRLRIWSRTAENRARFVAQAQSLFPFAVEESATLEEALADMPIVSLITRAIEPFVDASMLAKGAHVNAAGAILPTSAEIRSDVLEQADLVVVDNMDNARKASRELHSFYGADAAEWPGVVTLGSMLAEGRGRPDGAKLTVFKPMGMGLSDLAMAIAVYQSAVANGRGVKLPTTAVPMPRWTLYQG